MFLGMFIVLRRHEKLVRLKVFIQTMVNVYLFSTFTMFFPFIEKLHVTVLAIVYVYIYISISLNIKSACKNNIVTFDSFDILSHASETS